MLACLLSLSPLTLMPKLHWRNIACLQCTHSSKRNKSLYYAKHTFDSWKTTATKQKQKSGRLGLSWDSPLNSCPLVERKKGKWLLHEWAHRWISKCGGFTMCHAHRLKLIDKWHSTRRLIVREEERRDTVADEVTSHCRINTWYADELSMVVSTMLTAMLMPCLWGNAIIITI